MPLVESRIEIRGEARQVYELAKDMESYPEYMPDVESVKVVKRDDSSTITDWVTSVDGTPIVWKERDQFDDEALTIDYQLIEGDLDKFEGRWCFLPKGDATEVVLTVDFDFGMPTLAELLGPILEEKVRENSEMMLTAMKQRVEQS